MCALRPKASGCGNRTIITPVILVFFSFCGWKDFHPTASRLREGVLVEINYGGCPMASVGWFNIHLERHKS